MIGPPSTTVIIPTLNESKYVTRTVDSIFSQQVLQAYPDRFEVFAVDSGSEDGTQDLLRQMGMTVYNAPRGKLTARDLGIRMAEGKVIVSTDADTTYQPDHFGLMLRHFDDPSVVGVYGPHRMDGPWWLRTMNMASLWEFHRMWGSNSMLTKQAYYQVGGFDLSIDQQDAGKMIQEEEVEFAKRLDAVGKTVYEKDAVALVSGRRWYSSDPYFDEQVKNKVRFQEDSGIE